jgi:hypothetical protein
VNAYAASTAGLTPEARALAVERVLRGARDSAAAVVRAVTATLQPGGASVNDDRTLLVVRLPG